MTGTNTDFKDWCMYTAAMGIFPSIIKMLVLAFFNRPFLLEKFRVEIFFLTIIFLVDTLRKYDGKGGKKSLTLFILIISVVIYTIILLGDMNLFKEPLSSVVATWVIGGFLGASVILDISSYY